MQANFFQFSMAVQDLRADFVFTSHLLLFKQYLFDYTQLVCLFMFETYKANEIEQSS